MTSLMVLDTRARRLDGSSYCLGSIACVLEREGLGATLYIVSIDICAGEYTYRLRLNAIILYFLINSPMIRST